MKKRDCYVVIADHIVWFHIRGEQFALDPGDDVWLTEAEAQKYLEEKLVKPK